MKEKRYVVLNEHEQRLTLLSLNRLWNRVIAEGIDPIDVFRKAASVFHEVTTVYRSFHGSFRLKGLAIL